MLDAGLLCPIHILSSLKLSSLKALRQSPSPGRSSPKHPNLLFQQKQVQGMDKGGGTLLRCLPSSWPCMAAEWQQTCLFPSASGNYSSWAAKEAEAALSLSVTYHTVWFGGLIGRCCNEQALCNALTIVTIGLNHSPKLSNGAYVQTLCRVYTYIIIHGTYTATPREQD